MARNHDQLRELLKHDSVENAERVDSSREAIEINRGNCSESTAIEAKLIPTSLSLFVSVIQEIQPDSLHNAAPHRHGTHDLAWRIVGLADELEQFAYAARGISNAKNS